MAGIPQKLVFNTYFPVGFLKNPNTTGFETLQIGKGLNVENIELSKETGDFIVEHLRA